VATLSAVSAGGVIGTLTPLTPNITYTASAGENLILTGFYCFTNTFTTQDIIVFISVAVTGQTTMTYEVTVPAASSGNNGFLAIPYSYRYTGLSGAITVSVTATASIAGGYLSVQAVTSTTIAQRTTV
jgi:hypothetical protein